MSKYLFFLIFVNFLQFSFTSNILFVHLTCTSSHRTAIWPLAEELANSGHNITYIYPNQGVRVGSHPKIKEVTPSKLVSLLNEKPNDLINTRLKGYLSYIMWSLQLLRKIPQLCEAFYDSPEVDELLRSPNVTFDLVLIDAFLNECAYGLVHKFEAKHVLFSTQMLSDLYEGHGIVPESSSVPYVLQSTKPDEMSILRRIGSSIYYVFVNLLTCGDVHSVIKKKLNFTHFPERKQFERNTSLILINGHVVEEYPLALPPMVQSYSGLWCSKKYLSKPHILPESLETFIQSGQDGFIYFSFGTFVNSSGMPVSLRDEFFEVMGSFPKLRFLWKWGGDKPANIPRNVLLQNWFPQQAILGHPKIKGFINQAGRSSTQEALCFGVPVINLPVVGDQPYNANRLEQIGVSVIVSIHTFNGTLLRNAIKEIMTNPKYLRKNVRMSTLFRDRRIDPLENAVYWTEYVLKHDETSLLKPLGRNQTWFQRRLIDAYAFLAVILFLHLGLGFVITLVLLKAISRYGKGLVRIR